MSPVSKWRANAVHTIRMVILIAIVVLARLEHTHRRNLRIAANTQPIPIADLQSLVPQASSIDPIERTADRQVMLGASGKPAGIAITTSPQSDEVIGYVGPTNVLVVFDGETIAGIKILSSEDTIEHVAMIRDNDRFMGTLDGLSWETAATTPIDAVTGATLTSLGIEEAIHRRLGNRKRSLRFPNPVTVEELQSWLPSTVSIVADDHRPEVFICRDANGETAGSFVRTTPAADAINGYQGPCDVLIIFDSQGRAVRSALRGSFDNREPADYVGYVETDRYFHRQLSGMTLSEIANLDLDRIDGVSGATMTSSGVAESIVFAAGHAIQAPAITETASPRPWINPSWRDVGTIAVLTAALLMGFTSLNANRWLRYGFQIVLVVYFGFVNGDLISQTLLAGWSQSGIPIRNAAGLALLSAAAIAIPVFARKNLYCHHVCPFGAAQQLIRTRVKKPVKVPRRWHRWLSMIPAALLFLVFAAVFWQLPVNLAAIEPFDAFSVRAAGVATITVAAIGIVASCFVPMAYCQYGCPSGGLLQYVRRHRRSDQVDRRDALAIVLLLAAIATFVL